MMDGQPGAGVFLKFRYGMVNLLAVVSVRRDDYTLFKNGKLEKATVTKITAMDLPQRYFLVNAPFEKVIEFIVEVMQLGPGVYDLEERFPTTEDQKMGGVVFVGNVPV